MPDAICSFIIDSPAQSLQAERDEYKKSWDHCDEGWKDREDELRRILHGERDRELSQLKAEYDSYIGLLEQKLARTRSRNKVCLNIP